MIQAHIARAEKRRFSGQQSSSTPKPERTQRWHELNIEAIGSAAGNGAVSKTLGILGGTVQRCDVSGCVCAEELQLNQGAVQRSFILDPGNVVENKPLATAVLNGDYSLGYTPPTLNNVEIPGDVGGRAAAERAIAAPSIRGAPTGSWFLKGFYARVSNVPANHVGFNMYLPAVPPPWVAAPNKDYVAGLLAPDAEQCRNQQGNTAFYVRGFPDDQRLAQDVETHEQHHVRDHVLFAHRILGRWDQKLEHARIAGTRFRGSTPETAEERLFAAMGGRPDQIARQLHDEWGRASDEYHQTDQGRTNVHSAGASGDCSTSYLRFTVP